MTDDGVKPRRGGEPQRPFARDGSVGREHLAVSRKLSGAGWVERLHKGLVITRVWLGKSRMMALQIVSPGWAASSATLPDTLRPDRGFMREGSDGTIHAYIQCLMYKCLPSQLVRRSRLQSLSQSSASRRLLFAICELAVSADCSSSDSNIPRFPWQIASRSPVGSASS